MSKTREKAMDQAINLAVALRRKIVDCRFMRTHETVLLDKTSELIDMIVEYQAAIADGRKEVAETEEEVAPDAE